MGKPLNSIVFILLEFKNAKGETGIANGETDIITKTLRKFNKVGRP
jgi:hypothetical protein